MQHLKKGTPARQAGYHLRCIQAYELELTQLRREKHFSQVVDKSGLRLDTFYRYWVEGRSFEDMADLFEGAKCRIIKSKR